MARHHRWGQRSRNCIRQAHPDLRFWLDQTLARSPIDFGVYHGPRTYAEQLRKVAAGKSDTKNSRHFVDRQGFHYAVDTIPHPPAHPRGTWEPAYYFEFMREGFKVSAEYGIPVVWGGFWRNTSFGPDYVHIQLPWAQYPAHAPVTTWQERAESGLVWTCDPLTGRYNGQRTIARAS